MSATPAQVEAAHTQLWDEPCREIHMRDGSGIVFCFNHWDSTPWTERGCPVAVGIADTIADAT